MAPARIGPILATRLLSPWGKLRLGWELFVPARRDMADESLADFARRRFGNEVYQRMIQPLVGGIYTADPEQLSMQAAMPRFVEMERKWGSLAKAMRRQKATSAASGARSEHVHGVRYESFVAPREGIETLVTAIAKRLPAESIRRNTTVERLDRRADGTWSVVTSGPEALPPSGYRGVILALPAGVAAKLATPLDQELGAELKAITYAGASVVVLAYRRRDIAHPLDGFGAVVPQIERRKILAISFASNKFVDRAPADCILLRVFVGGALQGELMQLDDSEMLSLVEGELRELIGVRGDPVLRKVVRWNGTMPQYHVGHLDRVARIEARAAMLPGLELAGNAYHGVGIPYCVHSGERAADRILQSLPMALPV